MVYAIIYSKNFFFIIIFFKRNLVNLMASKTVSTATEMGMGPESGARFGNHFNLKNLPTYRCNRFVAP